MPFEIRKNAHLVERSVQSDRRKDYSESVTALRRRLSDRPSCSLRVLEHEDYARFIAFIYTYTLCMPTCICVSTKHFRCVVSKDNSCISQ